MSQHKPFSFAFVILPKFSGMSISALVEPLRIANYCAGEELYQWQYLSVAGGNIPSCSGISIETASLNSPRDGLDAVIVCGGWNATLCGVCYLQDCEHPADMIRHGVAHNLHTTELFALTDLH